MTPEQATIEQEVESITSIFTYYRGFSIETLIACKNLVREKVTKHLTALKQKESQLTSLAGQLHTKEVEYEMMKEERKGLYSSEQIENAFLEFWMTENFQLASGLSTFLINLKQQKEGK